MTNILYDGQHDRFDTSDRGEIFVGSFASVLEHLPHYEDDMQNELCIKFGNDHLLLGVKKMSRLDLICSKRIAYRAGLSSSATNSLTCFCM